MPVSLFGLFTRRRRKPLLVILATLGLPLLLAFATVTLNGCGSSSPPHNNNDTPAGSYSLTVNISGTTNHTANITVIVQ
jgi:hypothetical protein